METITLNIEKRTKELFWNTVKNEYGLKKGQLGKAANEALLRWVEEREQKKIAKRQLDFMKKGFHMGFRGYKNRDELYGRTN